MVTFAGLRDARLGPFAEAAEAWKQLAARLERAHRTVVDLQAKVSKEWKGRDAEAAHLQMQMLREKSYAAYQAALGIGRVLTAGHQRFKTAQTSLLEAIEEARSARFKVGDDGSLHYPPTREPLPISEQVLLQQRAEQIQKKMASALRAANEADQRVTQALSMLKSSILDITRAGEDPRQTMWRAVWEVNPHEVDGRRSLADIMKKYQVTKEPDGMTHFPDGFLEWVAKQLGKEPREVTESEKRALEELLRSRGIKGLIMFENNFNAAAEPPRSWAPGGGWQDGHGDAWRHAYWNALMTRDFGAEWTEKFTIAHERIADKNPGPREAMDLYNNEVGRQIALQHPNATNEELARYVRQAVAEGRMVVIDKDGQLAWSDQIAEGQTMQQKQVSELPEYGPGRDPAKVGR
ncbi:DUF6973 domain-containing protein [Thermomonospora catenispora]|uniref:DUF6973 domain-containing protein n=1 Tax=Thermomonospora catenispora TaxID=2493090 RepID=UPI00112366E3|nr:wnt family protein [Thermomonospora catenispora]TNY36169.1 hypothetical protein EIO00_14930 [Thermomonospora catenispora]